VATIRTTCFNTLNLCILPTECIYVFRMVLTIDSDCFPKQHYPVGLCSGDVMCFLWGTNWILIYYLEEIQSLKRWAILLGPNLISSPVAWQTHQSRGITTVYWTVLVNVVTQLNIVWCSVNFCFLHRAICLKRWRFWEVSVSNIGPDIDCLDWDCSRSSSVSADRYYLKSGDDRVLPHPFQFIFTVTQWADAV
jgi:hypothetical protein